MRVIKKEKNKCFYFNVDHLFCKVSLFYTYRINIIFRVDFSRPMVYTCVAVGRSGEANRKIRKKLSEVGNLTGEYSCTLDAKGRVAIPAKLRFELGDVIHVSKGLDQSLFIYADETWRKIQENLASMPISRARQLQLMLFPSAARFVLDTQGRILLPQKLREHAALEKDVVILGAGNRAEIWSEPAWRCFESAELTPEKMLEAMDELGF